MTNGPFERAAGSLNLLLLHLADFPFFTGVPYDRVGRYFKLGPHFTL